ncbi:MAG: hypothetical protein ACFFED_14865 [Candidatus Thorarchaeota archaeon]
MKEPIGYNIVTYGLFLQNEQKDFGKLLDKPIHVSAIITCHPSDTKDFKKAYFIFVDGKHIPEFKYPDHIRDDESGDRCVYIFRSSQFYREHVDLLRNEKPIALWWSQKNNTWQLATGKSEPVGEGAGEH